MIFPSRRRLLQVVGSLTPVALTGCVTDSTDATVTLTLSPVTDDELVFRSTDSLSAYEDEIRQAIENAISGTTGTLYAESTPLSQGTYILHDDTVFTISFQRKAYSRRYQYAISFQEVDRIKELDDRELIAYSDLPGVDRSKIESENDGGTPIAQDGVVPLSYTAEERENSVLVPDPEYELIKWPSDSTSQVEILNETTVILYEFEYRADVVFEDFASYSNYLKNEYLFEITDPTTSEKRILETAIDGTYQSEIQSEPDTALQNLADRFEAADPIIGESGTPSGEYVLRYEREQYWAEFNYNVPPDWD